MAPLLFSACMLLSNIGVFAQDDPPAEEETTNTKPKAKPEKNRLIHWLRIFPNKNIILNGLSGARA